MSVFAARAHTRTHTRTTSSRSHACFRPRMAHRYYPPSSDCRWAGKRTATRRPENHRGSATETGPGRGRAAALREDFVWRDRALRHETKLSEAPQLQSEPWREERPWRAERREGGGGLPAHRIRGAPNFNRTTRSHEPDQTRRDGESDYCCCCCRG